MGLFNRIKASFRALFPRRYAWPGLDISLPGGQHLHLVGSIHMGTQDMSPLPPGLIKLLKRAEGRARPGLRLNPWTEENTVYDVEITCQKPRVDEAIGLPIGTLLQEGTNV